MEAQHCPRLAASHGPAQADSQLGEPRPHSLQSQGHRLLAALLFVGGAHRRPLLVGKQRQVGGAWDVALGELGRAAHVQQWPARFEKGLHLACAHLAGSSPPYLS